MIAAIVGDSDDIESARQALESLQMETLVDSESTAPSTTKKTKYQLDLDFLQQSFPNIALRRLIHRYEACDNDLDRVTDELLNTQAIDEMGVEAYTQGQSKNPKGKKGNMKQSTGVFTEKEQDDVKFLQKALNVNEQQARSIYESNDQSLTKSLDIKINPDTSQTQSQTNVWTGETVKRPQRLPPNFNNSMILSNRDTKEAELELSKHNQNKDQAWQRSREMFRKSKSNPLYRSAAGVYSEVARDHHAQSQSIQDRIHTSQIEKQSSASVIDCHGIPASNAVQYIGDRLSSWLYNPHDSHNTLTIITGSGQHSAGGVPKIKNMVRRRLKSENTVTSIEHSSYFVITRKLSYRH